MPAILAVFAIVATAGTLTSFNVFSVPSSSLDTQSNGNGGINMQGHLEIVAKNPNGQVTAYRQTDNIVTAVGKSCVGVRLFGANNTGGNGTSTACGGYRQIGKFSIVAIGTGATAETTHDTDLGAIDGARGNATSTGLMNSTGGQTIYSIIQRQFQQNVSAASVTESGLFDQVATGAGSHMFARKTFTAITLNPLDTLTVTWRITYS
jgi:hypothetical protein